jgi:hypothetical protein
MLRYSGVNGVSFLISLLCTVKVCVCVCVMKLFPVHAMRAHKGGMVLELLLFLTSVRDGG